MSIGSFFSSIFGGNSGGASRTAERAAQGQANDLRTDTDRRAVALRQGMADINTSFGGFDDSYFRKLQQDYTDYNMPQLRDQYDDAKSNILFSLARKGNLASTTAGDQYGKLDRQNAVNVAGIEGAGKDYANQARTVIQGNKQDAIGQLYGTYDADAANSVALSNSKSMAVPKPTFSPLGQMFQNISAVAAQNKIASESDPDGYRPSSSGVRTYSPAASTSYVRGK